MTRRTISAAMTVAMLAASALADDDPGSVLRPELLEPTQVELVSAAEFQQVLAHHRGEVVLVNLWATWCIPCIQELPDLDLLQRRYGERGLRVIGVSFDDPEKLEEQVRPFFAEKAPSLISYLQTEDDQYAFVEPLDPDWVGAMPTSFFIDRDGEIRGVHTGRLLYRDLERKVLEILGPATAGD